MNSFDCRSMIVQSRYLYLLIFDLFVECLLTLISSMNIKYLLICLIFNIILILKCNIESDLFLIHYLSSLIFVLFHYIIFTLSYAEILPWETGIVIVLLILIIYYNRKLILLRKKSHLNG